MTRPSKLTELRPGLYFIQNCPVPDPRHTSHIDYNADFLYDELLNGFQTYRNSFKRTVVLFYNCHPSTCGAICTQSFDPILEWNGYFPHHGHR